jgi:sigma-B regulation protein RsbU (phosphoserine phosphatase)
MRNLQSLFSQLLTLSQKNWSLSAKISAAYCLVIIIGAGGLTTNLYLQLVRTQRQAIRDRLLDIVSLAVPQIDSDYHSLIVTPADQQQPYYRILQQRLEAIETASKDINRIYTLRQKPDDSIVIVLDHPTLPQQPIQVGEKLTELTPILQQDLNNIKQPVVERNFAYDSTGKAILYGYAPIVSPLGRFEGILAIQLDNSQIINIQNQAKSLAIITFLITLLIALIIGWWLGRRLTSPIKELVAGAEAIAKGELDREVKVRSQDEVGVLAATFNYMTNQLKQSFENLEAKVTERTAQLQQANQEISHLNELLKAENVRMSAELEVSRRLQKMILPKEEELRQITELDIVGFMEPADEVGGDYYDVIRQNGSIKISIGDVTGHGLESGVLAIMVQTAFRTLLTHNETDLGKILNTLNRTIYDNVQRMDSHKNLTLALLDYGKGTLTFSGQHEEIIVVRTSGEIERIDTFDLGFPIGLEQNIANFVSSATLELSVGDVVVLYTDGITEAENIHRQQYGLEKLMQVVQVNVMRSATEIRQAVIDDLRQHIGEQKLFDDITLVVFKPQK